MIDYTGFARFCDRITGDRAEEIARIQSHVSRHLPGARSLLELGCGTGAILAASRRGWPSPGWAARLA